MLRLQAYQHWINFKNAILHEILSWCSCMMLVCGRRKIKQKMIPVLQQHKHE